MSNRIDEFEKIIGLSKTMLECAKNGAWEDLSETETNRQVLMKVFFDQSILEAEADWLEPGIKELLNLDRLIVQLSKDELDAIANSVQQMKKGKEGASAYQRNV